LIITTSILTLEQMTSYKSAHKSPPNWVKELGTRGDKIGILTPGYGLEKVSYGINPDNYQYVKVNRVPIQRIVKGQNVITQCPFIIGGSISLFHSFNMLPLNGNFIVSYETELPRFLGNSSEKQLQVGYNILKSDRCKGIYALSEAGQKFAQKRMIDRGMTDLADSIKVFRGGFHSFDIETSIGSNKGAIKACFVGGQLFHKGIEATIDALQILRDGGVNIELEVVGKAEDSSYAVPGLRFDKARLLRDLQEKSWITYSEVLPNDQIIALFKKSDLLLFPSIDESLGWVLVEAAMCGIPRLSTNIYAFPELIEHEKDGWMVDLPLNEDLRWLHVGKTSAKDAWYEGRDLIVKGIVGILGNSSINKDRLSEMGGQAQKKMQELYGLSKAREELQSIYSKAIR